MNTTTGDEFWCLHCPRPAWSAGGAPAVATHLWTGHGIHTDWPVVQPVDAAGEPVDWSGAPTDPDWGADALVCARSDATGVAR